MSELTSAEKSLASLSEYKATLCHLFPLSKSFIDYHSITDNDAFAIALLLRRLECEVFVVEVGVFVGVSTFHLANQPSVREVFALDPNPSLRELQTWEGGPQGDCVPDVHILDVAGEALQRFPEARRKIRLIAGTTESVDIPKVPEGACEVAFVDGSHEKRWVKADLRAIFARSAEAIAVLHDCNKGPNAPEVLAGISAFLEEVQSPYRFRLMKGKAPYRKSFNLGVLYPESRAQMVERAARGFLDDPTREWLRSRIRRLRKQRA